MSDVEGKLAAASTRAMKRATRDDLLVGLRGQIIQAGMGQRLANTWRGKVYPEKGNSLTPTGYVWSNAPDIIDAFSRGATIRPVNGSNYLWIPTINVPRARRRQGRNGRLLPGGRLTPDEVEAQFDAEFVILPAKGKGLTAFIPAIRALNGRKERRSTKGRLAQGREERLIPMFNLRRSVKMPKTIDLPSEGDQAAQAYGRYLPEEIARS